MHIGGNIIFRLWSKMEILCKYTTYKCTKTSEKTRLLQFFQIQFTGLCLAMYLFSQIFEKRWILSLWSKQSAASLSWSDLFFRILEIYCAANDSYYFIVKEVTPYLLKPIFLAHYVCQSCVTIIPFLKSRRWMQFFADFCKFCIGVTSEIFGHHCPDDQGLTAVCMYCLLVQFKMTNAMSLYLQS